MENMTVEQLEARKAEIANEIDSLETVEEVNERSAEFDAINAELEARKAMAAKKAEIREAVAKGAGVVIEKIEERKEMNTVEVRNSVEYINAYADYIKTGKDEECRALLSTNGTSASASLTGYVPVPEIVEDIVRTAWEKNDILNLVKKTYVQGNLKVAFELSADAAVVHAEGSAAPTEETITLGIVSLIPESIKKWITISDEALDLSGEAFLRYIYEELTYQIAKKVEAELIAIIADLPSTATTTSVSAATLAEAPALTTIATAMGNVVGSNLSVAMNRGTWAKFKAVQYKANFAIDIFEGLNVIFTDALPAFDNAAADEVYAIVGDFYEGAQANFPNGEEISIKIDNLSLAEKDLVKFVGREFVGLGAVADKRFCLIAVPN